MKYTVLTLFPEIIDGYFAASIMAKALQKGIIEYKVLNIRDFAVDKHKTCDDATYGGGPGMLMLPEPLSRALEAVGIRKKGTGDNDSNYDITPGLCPDNSNKNPHSPLPTPHSPYVIYLSPSGKPFTQALARELAKKNELVLLCGRYEGIDQRIIDLYIDDEISVGDYVLSSGEVAALAVIDATYRLVDRVITPESLEEESFSHGLLEYPQYTRPEIFDTIKVPDVLLSGHHENIRKWRLEKRVEKTISVRPDLIREGMKEGVFNKEIIGIMEQKVSAGGDTNERN